MGKYNRRVVGSVYKGKKDEQTGVLSADYIKIRDDISFRKGQVLRLESAEQQLTSLKKAVSEGKLSPDVGEQVQERIGKIPTYVRFEIVSLEEKAQQ